MVLSGVWISATPWTVGRQAPLPMEFSRQESWSGLPFPAAGDLPDPGIQPASLVSPASAGGSFTSAPPGKPLLLLSHMHLRLLHVFSWLSWLILFWLCGAGPQQGSFRSVLFKQPEWEFGLEAKERLILKSKGGEVQACPLEYTPLKHAMGRAAL